MTPSAKRSLSTFNPHIDLSRKRFCSRSTVEVAEACGEVLLYFDEESRKRWGAWLQCGLDSVGAAGTLLTSSQVAPMPQIQGPSFEEQRCRGSVTPKATQHLAAQRFRPRGQTPQRPGASVFRGRMGSDAGRFPHLSVFPSGLPAAVVTRHHLSVLSSYLTKCFWEKL